MIKRFIAIRKKYFDNTVDLSKLSKTFLLWAVGLVLVYVSNIYLVKITGLETYGKYTVFINWTALISTVLLFGWDGYLMQRVPQLQKNKNGKIAGTQLLRKAALSFLISYIIFAVIAIIVLKTAKISPAFSNNEYLVFFLVLTFLFSAITFFKAFLKIFNVINKVQWAEDVAKPLFLFIIILVYYNTTTALSLSSLYWLNSIAMGIIAILFLFFAVKTYHKNFEIQQNVTADEKWLVKCFYFMCIFLGYSIFSRMELLLLGHYAKDEDAAKYQILLRIADLVILPDFLFNYFLPQKFAHHFANGKNDEAKQLFKNSSVTIFLLQVICFAGVAAVGYFYLQSFNIANSQTYLLLLLMAIAPIFYSLFGSSNLVLKTSGNERYSFYALLIVLLLELAANYLFTATYGLIAAVIISVSSVFLYTLLLSFFVFKKLQFYNTVTRILFFVNMTKASA
jgi:O-antigen/teichoic acid export membrane protein